VELFIIAIYGAYNTTKDEVDVSAVCRVLFNHCLIWYGQLMI
jgi:hypothetical protein